MFLRRLFQQCNTDRPGSESPAGPGLQGFWDRTRWNGRRLRRVRKSLVGGESLEIRDVMSADPVLACIATQDAPMAAAASAEVGSDDTFESAEALTDTLIARAVSQYQNIFGTSTPWYWPAFHDVALVGAPNATLMANFNFYVGPTHQVSGVAESDLMESDGRFVYTIADRQLIVTDTQQPSNLSILSRTALEGQSQSMYLVGDRLVVLSTEYAFTEPYYQPYWLDYRMAPNQPSTLMTVFDVSDRAHPNEVASKKLESMVVDSRVIGSTLYLVTNNEFSLPAPMMVSDPTAVGTGTLGGDGNADLMLWPYTIAPDRNMRYETQEEYVTRIRPLALGLVLPEWGDDVDGDATFNKEYLVGAEQVVRPKDSDDGMLITISTWDLQESLAEPIDLHSQVFSTTPTVFMNQDSIVLATPDWNAPTDTASNPDGNPTTHEVISQNMTELAYLSVNDLTGAINYEGRGEVVGALVDRYSLDERNGVVRVAVVQSQFGVPQEASNDLYTLEISDGSLEIVGHLSDLAQGETIRSVRYTEDRAYVVTFPVPTFEGLPFDPLFVIDLTDATSPEVLGELEVSGFSTRMLVIDENHLIGIGREIDPETRRDLGLQVSLFDVSDPAEPTLVDRHLFEGMSTSEAEWDLHSVSYDAATGTLVLPVQMTRSMPWPPAALPNGLVWLGDDTGGIMAANYGLQVLRVDVDRGFESLGVASMGGWNGRSRIIGNTLIARTDTQISTYSLNDLGSPLDSIVLVTRAESDHFAMPEGDETTFEIDVLANDLVADGSSLTITRVDDIYGALSISADGKRVIFDASRLNVPIYQMPGQNTWYYGSYETRDTNGVVTTGSLTIVVRPSDDAIIIDPIDPIDPPDDDPWPEDPTNSADPVMEFDVEFVDASGNAISSIVAGAEFYADIYVEDTREHGTGVFSAYVDVVFGGVAVTIDDAVERGAQFGSGLSGTASANEVDELGGVGGANRSGAGRQHLARVALSASQAGSLQVRLNAPDLAWHDNTVYDRNTEVSAIDIAFGSDELTIVDPITTLTSVVEGDVDGNGEVTPLDALLIINALPSNNSNGAQTQMAAISENSQSGSDRNNLQPRYRLDQDGNGEVTPLDALLVINKL